MNSTLETEAKSLGSEIGLSWLTITEKMSFIDNTLINAMRWVKIHRYQLITNEGFIGSLYKVDQARKPARMMAFLQAGFTLPEEVKRNDFDDFFSDIMSLCNLVKKRGVYHRY